ncbi:MAG: helix-turn-helix domain-containing protein [Myxococcales bacterium]|nr:helix-turn-helix domain-containing protein [Myxococcales bacterium]MCB9534292.1 helix-turn-helix domain-containing protein [Myxococcales bacterium]
MPKLSSFVIDGLLLFFYSADHAPPHFHASRPGEWEIRVFIDTTTVERLHYTLKYPRGAGCRPPFCASCVARHARTGPACSASGRRRCAVGSAGRTVMGLVTVVDAGLAPRPWLTLQSSLKVVRSSWDGVMNDANILVLTPASRLPSVTRLIRGAQRLGSLRGVLVETDVDPGMLPQVLDDCGVVTLTKLLAHSDFAVPKRVVDAWRLGAAGELIANAVALTDRLLVVSCALDRTDVPWTALPALATLSEGERAAFVVEEHGSFLHWPQADVHLDLDGLRVASSPARRRAAERLVRDHDAQLGAAIRSLREDAGLRQRDIQDLTERQLRRVEAGQVRPRVATYEALAAAHGLALADYLNAIADRAARGET